jgi:hypothetical protein
VIAALLLAQVVARPVAEVRELAPRAASWDEMARSVLDPRWILPSDLPLADERGVAWLLEDELPRRVALLVPPSVEDPTAPRSFGDLAARARGADAQTIEALLERTRKSQPALWEALAPFAKELLRDERLRAEAWDPEEDRGNDGLFLARPLTLAGRRDAPWSALSGSRLVQQGAALVYADLEAIKAAENDFTTYRARPGTSYERIFAREESHLRGLDPEGRPFAALGLFFESDLPFPFGSYECELGILNRVRADGRIACDILSTSADFHWMAGRDLFVPVRASDDTWQGTLVVRLFGFDLRDVPDGDEARRAGLRTSLGSLKREGEAAFRTSGGAPRTLEGTLPEFVVRSRR